MTRSIVYLHGFASSPASQKARFFRERLEAEGCRVEVPDLSQGDFENLTITAQLRVIEQVAAGRPVTLIGSSLGGYLAALYAARHPETERLLLLAPAFGFARRWAATLGGELEEWKQKGWRMVYHYGDQRPRLIRYRLIEDGLQYEDYPRFTQPALIFHGQRDQVVVPEWSEEFARGRPNVTLVLVDSDHELLDALELIWERSRGFLLGGAGSRSA
ncbi:MAG: alpha/beta hydrolase [Bryobacteraceae bacterium]